MPVANHPLPLAQLSIAPGPKALTPSARRLSTASISPVAPSSRPLYSTPTPTPTPTPSPIPSTLYPLPFINLIPSTPPIHIIYILYTYTYIYIIYTPNLGLGIAVFVRGREYGRFRGSTKGAGGSRGSIEGAAREHEGAEGSTMGQCRAQ